MTRAKEGIRIKLVFQNDILLTKIVEYLDLQNILRAVRILVQKKGRKRKWKLPNGAANSSDGTRWRQMKEGKKRKVTSNNPGLTRMFFGNEDLVGNIVKFLDGKSILFGMGSVSKIVKSRLTHKHAVCCAMTTPSGRRRMQNLANLIRRGCIYTPSPMRILRLGMGKRCEICNRTKTNDVNSLGLFLCRSCTHGIICEIKPHNDFGRVVIKDERCAKRILWSRKKKRPRYFVYSGMNPFVDGAGEKIGPLAVLFHHIKNMSSVNYYPSSKTFDKIFENSRVDDRYRSKASSILKAAEFVPKYIHLGILEHIGPRTRWNYSSEWKVLVQWEKGERTWEPLTRFAEDDFDTCVSYANDHKLIYTKGWERFRI